MTQTPNTSVSSIVEDILGRVRVVSGVYLRGEFGAPWSLETNQEELSQCVAPGAKRLVVLHLAIEGAFWISLPTGERTLVEAREGVVLPYSDAHTMGSVQPAPPLAIAALLPKPPWSELPVVARYDGGGAKTQVLCGFLQCDDVLFDPILRALPRLIHLRATGSAAHWREASLRYAVERASSPETSELSARIPEMVLVDALRQYVETMPPEQTGWLAALRDPLVGPAIARLHAAPAESWSVPRLAEELAVSRSLLAERFNKTLGQPPMRYLGTWRLQLAANLLRSTTLSVGEVAPRVGFDSEAAFSRAFKRRFRMSPAHWRLGTRRSGVAFRSRN